MHVGRKEKNSIVDLLKKTVKLGGRNLVIWGFFCREDVTSQKSLWIDLYIENLMESAKQISAE